MNSCTGRQKDKLRKEIIKLFKDHGFQITIEINLRKVDFLDVQLDLDNASFYPYRKPNDEPIFISKESNHPPHILKQIPQQTSKRLSGLSCNEEEFKKAVRSYKPILEKSGFKEPLIFTQQGQSQTRRNRKRKFLWYNPPFDLQVQTNLGKEFLKLIDKHFPRHHKLNKILNRNTVKISYSCLPNIGSLISSHNKKILRKIERTNERERNCNCMESENCPLNGECLTKALIYEGTVIPERGNPGRYIGLCEPAFKGRYSDHKTSCTYQRYETKTELSEFFWKNKKQGINSKLEFKIIDKRYPYRIGATKCDLCLCEKLLIMKEGKKVINTRDELVSKCKHAEKFLLRNYKDRTR